MGWWNWRTPWGAEPPRADGRADREGRRGRTLDAVRVDRPGPRSDLREPRPRRWGDDGRRGWR